MSIQQDKSWPQHIIALFDYARRKTPAVANRFYGAYNGLLSYCFKLSEFAIAPQLTPKDDNGVPIGELVVYIIVYDTTTFHPVLLVEVKDDHWAESAETRLRADQSMRQHLDEMLAECDRPRLWGLSLLGTAMRVYRADKATHDVRPPFSAHRDRGQAPPPDYLEGEWNLDIMTQDGFDKMREIVDEISAGL